MPEKPSHRRAKNKAAGPGGRTEVPLPGGKRLDARTQGGGGPRDRSRAQRQRSRTDCRCPPPETERRTDESVAGAAEGYGRRRRCYA